MSRRAIRLTERIGHMVGAGIVYVAVTVVLGIVCLAVAWLGLELAGLVLTAWESL